MSRRLLGACGKPSHRRLKKQDPLSYPSSAMGLIEAEKSLALLHFLHNPLKHPCEVLSCCETSLFLGTLEEGLHS